MATNDMVFKSFVEYWHYARHLSDKQRELILNSLSTKQRHFLVNAYKGGGWDYVFTRNEIDKVVDELEEKYNYNLIDIKRKVIKGKSVYLPRQFWQIVCEQIGNYGEEHSNYVLGGIQAVLCRQNKDVVLLVKRGDNFSS